MALKAAHFSEENMAEVQKTVLEMIHSGDDGQEQLEALEKVGLLATKILPSKIVLACLEFGFYLGRVVESKESLSNLFTKGIQ